MRVAAQVGSAANVEDSDFDTGRFLVKYRLVSRSFIKFSTGYSNIAFGIPCPGYRLTKVLRMPIVGTNLVLTFQRDCHATA